MRRFRYAFVSNSAEIGSSVVSCADPQIEEVLLNLATMEEAVPVARRLLASGIDVVIGGGGTGGLLADSIGQPVVKLERNPIDLLDALVRARKKTRKIAVTNFANPLDGVRFYEELLSLRIQPVVFSNSEELQSGIDRAVKQGCEVIVGGGVCRQMARARGAEGIIVVPSEEGIREALRQARDVARDMQGGPISREELRRTVELVGEALVVVDHQCRVKFVNKSGKAMLESLYPGCKAADLLGKPLPSELGIFTRQTQGSSKQESICRIGNVELALSFQPIVVDGEYLSSVVRLYHPRAPQTPRREATARKGFTARYTLDQVKGGDLVQAVVDKARRYAAADAAILIEGETGTGKELIAQGIHNASERSHRPFVAINCSALPESLLESELFGYEEGAFTGARRGGKPGLIELANSGTLFLDEVADISPSLQVRLLRALEEKEIMRLGSDRITPVDVRIISASQTDLYAAAVAGRFRLDLFFRLGTLRIKVPPVRERLTDLLVLLQALFKKYNHDIGPLPKGLQDFLKKHRWPGNIRELDALVQTYLALRDKDQFDVDLFESIFNERCGETAEAATPAARSGTLREQIRDYEITVIERALKECRYNRKETARKLKISVNSLWRKSRRKMN